MSDRTKGNNLRPESNNSNVIDDFLKELNEKNQETSVASVYSPKNFTPEKREEITQAIKEGAENYYKATDADKVLEDVYHYSFASADKDQKGYDRDSAVVLDQWNDLYKNGHDVYELTPLLDIAAAQNISPSELMKKDKNFRQLVDMLSVREFIPDADEITNKNEDVNLNSSKFYWQNDNGHIDLSVQGPQSNNNEPLQSIKTDQVQKSEAQRAKLTVDLVNKHPVDPKALDVAKQHNLPPSIILSDNPELKKLVEQFSSQQLDTTIDTPVTFQFLQNGEFANQFSKHTKELQSIEQQLNEDNKPYFRAGIWYKNKQAWLDAMQSDNVINNLGYGITKTAVGALGAFNWLLKKSPFTFKFGGSSVTEYIDRSISTSSDFVDRIPRDVKGMERAGEIFADEDGGFFASTGFVLSSPMVLVNMLANELPSSYFGGGIVNKAFPLAGKAVGVVKDIVGAGLGSFFGNLSPNVVEANEKTDDPSEAVAMAERKTAIQASSDMILAPLGYLSPKKFTSISKPINSAVQGAASYALTQYRTDGEVTAKDTYLAALTGLMTSFGELNKQTLLDATTSLYRDTVSHAYQSMAISEMVKNNPEASREFFNQFKDNMIVIPSDAFVKIMTDQGKNPYQVMSDIYGDNGAYLQRQVTLGDSISLSLGNYIVELLHKNNLDAKLFEMDIKKSRTGLTPNEQKALAQGYSSYYNTVQKNNKEKIEIIKKITQKYKKQGSPISEKNALLEFSFSDLLNLNSFDGDILTNKFTFDIASSSTTKRGGSNQKKPFIQLDNKTNKVTIDLTYPIDVKTFVAETSNLFINGLLANNQNAHIAKDLSMLQKHFKINDLHQMTAKQKKQINDSLMDFLKTGKSDNAALKPIFDRYRNGVVEFYKNSNVLKPNFKQDLTQQLDRLAWTNFVSSSLSQAPYKSLFDNNWSVLTPNERLIYQDLQKNIPASLQDKLYQQYNAESVKKKQQEIAEFERQAYKEEAAKEEANPIYAVRDFLTKGILLDGRLGKKVKLDEADVVNHYGRNILKQLPGLTQKNGVSLEHIVNLYNIESKDVLVNSLINSSNKEKIIKRNIEQKVRDKYGDSIDLKSIFMEGRNLLEHDVNRSNMLWLESKVLLREQNKLYNKIMSDAELNALVLNDSSMFKQAEIFLNQIPEGMLTQERYFGLLQQKSDKAKEAYDRGDFAQALKTKQEERLLLALYIQSKKKEADRIKINNLIEKVKLSVFDLDY